MKQHKYICELCKCNLDPGEGRMCEECREKEAARKRLLRMRQYQQGYRALAGISND